jgi:hypothetical protein
MSTVRRANLVNLIFTDRMVWATRPDPETNNGRICYVAGPMTGLPGFNYRSFDGARDQLAREGWTVINPADLDRINLDIDFSVMTGQEDISKYGSAFARQDIESLLHSDAVFLLPGWEKSRGATNEARIATMLGVPLYGYETRDVVTIEAKFSSGGV